MDCHGKLLIEGSNFVVYSLLKSTCQIKNSLELMTDLAAEF